MLWRRLAVIATFIGGGVAASADVTAIRVALLAILLVPVLLMPRFRSVWPGAELPRNVGVHAGRSLFVVLQYAGVGLLMMSLIQPVLDADKTSEARRRNLHRQKHLPHPIDIPTVGYRNDAAATSDGTRYDHAELIDLDRYPIDRPGRTIASNLIGTLRQELAEDGCAVIKGFIRTEALPGLIAEGDGVSPQAYRSFNRTNPYFSQDDPDLPPEHPLRRFEDRSNAFIPGRQLWTRQSVAGDLRISAVHAVHP